MLVLGTCLAALPARGEAPPQIALSYHVYAGGLHVLTSEATVQRRGGSYGVRVKAQTNGLLDSLFRFSLEAEAAGVNGNAGIRPQRFRVANRWRENPERLVEITYPVDGPPKTLVVPPATEDDRDPVPMALRSGTVDPISAVLGVVMRLAENDRCEADVPIFDGRRRYNVIAEHRGMVELKASDIAPFGGRATRCGLGFELLGGGWKKKSKRWREAGQPEIEVFLARVLPEEPLLPVRVHAKNNLGALRIHLVSARRVTNLTQFGP